MGLLSRPRVSTSTASVSAVSWSSSRRTRSVSSVVPMAADDGSADAFMRAACRPAPGPDRGFCHQAQAGRSRRSVPGHAAVSCCHHRHRIGHDAAGARSRKVTKVPGGTGRLAEALPAEGVMFFADRADAGRRLAPGLEYLRGEPVVVPGLLARRLTQVTWWLRARPRAAGAAVGYFGASTGAAAAPRAAAGSSATWPAAATRWPDRRPATCDGAAGRSGPARPPPSTSTSTDPPCRGSG